MSHDLLTQFDTLLQKTTNALILLPSDPSGDAIGSGWALSFFLAKKKIKSTIGFSDSLDIQKRYSFLKTPENVVTKLHAARDFVLSFNTTHNKIINIRSAQEGEEFRIYITPEKGSIDPRDFSFVPAYFKYDLVIVLDAPDKESLGSLYEENPDLFYEVPIVNIDAHPGNEQFGQVNFVSFTASSVSEILSGIFAKLDEKSLDENISECLLTGILCATDRFQNARTTPQALLAAARLMDSGADQQKIVRWLYKTHPFHVLKLWGRVMSRLEWNDQLKYMWAYIPPEDFLESQSQSTDLFMSLEQIKNNYSSGDLFFLFYKNNDGTFSGVSDLGRSPDRDRIIKTLHGQKKGSFTVYDFSFKTITDVTSHVLKVLERRE